MPKKASKRKRDKRKRAEVESVAKKAAQSAKNLWTAEVVAASKFNPAAAQGARAFAERSPFAPVKPPPGVVPDDAPVLAFDDSSNGNVSAAAIAWAGSVYNYAFSEGLQFLGYPYLAELAQRPEYRKMVELIATEMTRKWIKMKGTGDTDKTEKIKEIMAECDRLGVRGEFKTAAEQDGFFGRSHLYIDTGDTDNPEELKMPIGDGVNKLSRSKVGKGELEGMRCVEAVWTYPTTYNSNDPLRSDWYKPTVWYVMGKQVHVSRLITFVGREVPDLLKPAYSFGGLALTQLAKPYVDNWLRTRQSVTDIISAFSCFVLSTNLSETLQKGNSQVFARADAFNNMRSNRGMLMIDKESEDFKNISASLAGLDSLQAQSQEHLCTVAGAPKVKLLGLDPAGLNASSEMEIRVFYDWVMAYQEALFREPLTTVLGFVQLSLYGEVDDEITFDFEPLWALSEKEHAEVDKANAETHMIYVDGGVIGNDEVRKTIVNNPDSPYHGLNPDDAPDLLGEIEEGLEPLDGRPDPLAGQKGKNPKQPVKETADA